MSWDESFADLAAPEPWHRDDEVQVAAERENQAGSLPSVPAAILFAGGALSGALGVASALLAGQHALPGFVAATLGGWLVATVAWEGAKHSHRNAPRRRAPAGTVAGEASAE